MHSMWEGTLLQAELLSLSCSRDKLCVVEVVVVHFVQLYFVNAYQTNKHPMLLNPFELVVVPLFAIFRRHWIYITAFESLSLHLLMNFNFWWFPASDELAYDELASDDVITSGALCLQEHFDFRSSSLQMLLSFLFAFCLFLCSLLFFQNLLMISEFLSMVMYTCANISISNWQFLIPCYHQNS